MGTLLTPPQQRIAAGMSPLAAYLTDHTCGEACWEAREDVCRCSCGGKNHGCMRDPAGKRPERTAKIDGFRYVLRGIGDVYDSAKAINKAAGYKAIDRINDTLTYHYSWDDTDKGAPARRKPATRSQREAWPELAAYRETPQYNSPYLLWVREDVTWEKV